MALTPETLPRHELNGLRVAVVEATNPDLVGISGRVVVETMRTLHVDTGADGPAGRTDSGRSDLEDRTGRRARVKQVPKRGATFEFALDAERTRTGEAAGYRRQGVDVDPDADDSPGTARRARKGPGTASEPEPNPETSPDGDRAGTGDGAAHVTVDGAALLSRPARRTEDAGDSIWQ